MWLQYDLKFPNVSCYIKLDPLFNLPLTTCGSPCEAQKRPVISFPNDLFGNSFLENFIL